MKLFKSEKQEIRFYTIATCITLLVNIVCSIINYG
jgi:hypothetical protein